MIAAHVLLFGASFLAVFMIGRRIWTDPAARRPMAMAAAWGWALIAVILLAPMLGSWYLVWVLPLAWALPRVARRTLVVLCLAFTVTELVTENSHLPELIRSVRLPFGHPVAIAVCVWIAADLIRRLVRHTPLEAETPEPRFGDRFEAGPAMPKHIELPAVVTAAPDDEPVVDDAETPAGALGPMTLAHPR